MIQQTRLRSTLMIMLGCAGLLALSAMFHSNVGGEILSPPTFSSDPAITVMTNGLLVDWRIPEAEFVTRADATTAVHLPGDAQTSQPGAPVLPFFSMLVAVPPGALPTLRVLLLEETEYALPGPLALAPFPAGVQRNSDGQVYGGDFAAVLLVQPVHSNITDPVMLEPAGVVRGVRLARLVFYPARLVGPGPKMRLRVTTHIRVAITFAGQPGDDLPHTTASDPVLAALRATVINPSQVQPGASAGIQNINITGPVWTALEVDTPGITAITYATLAENGFPVGIIDPHLLHLTHAGLEIAAEWDGNENTSFEPGERLLFYAAPRFSRWTSTDVYQLWQDGYTPGLRMETRLAVPTGQPEGIAWVEAMAEDNQLYTPDCFCGSLPPGRDGDRWTWADMKRPGQATTAYTLTLPTMDATQPATLTLWLVGYTDLPAVSPDHRVAASLNNVFLGDVEWNGQQAITATLAIPPGHLRTTNTLTLTLPGLPGVGIEGAWLDAFAIRYARGSDPVDDALSFTGQPTAHAYTLTLNATTDFRAYDVTNPERPLRLTGVLTNGYTISLSDPLTGGVRRYDLTTDNGLHFPVSVRPAEGLQTTGGADYVIIAPAALISALGDLIALRRDQGLTVAVETVQAIYDVHGDGRPDPAAIHAYLAHAYATWTPRPTYVLLVGAGSFDPRRYRDTSPTTVIPPYLADVDPWAGETAADNRYVTVDGADSLPDMMIGRLPVHTLTETQTVVDKIVQYELRPLPGGWNEVVTFVADKADEAGDFAEASEVLASTYVTVPFTAQRIYYTPPATDLATTRQAVLDAFTNGALIIHYTGHASWQQWSADRLLHLDDLSALRNDRRLPIVLEMTCFTGAFQRPEPTLDAELLTQHGGGVVAAWGATGLGVSTGHSSLAGGFFQAVLIDRVSTVGQATLAGKLSLAAAGQQVDLLDTFTLLGDPALRLNLTITPWTSQTYLPHVMRK